jgi:hypothetical protein
MAHGWSSIPNAGTHTVDLTPEIDEDDDGYFNIPVARSFDSNSVRCSPRSTRICSLSSYWPLQRRSKSPIFPENALQLTLDAEYPASSPSPSTTHPSGSESLPSTSYTLPPERGSAEDSVEPVLSPSDNSNLHPSPGRVSPPVPVPATAPAPVRPGHVRFHSRVRIASGLHTLRRSSSQVFVEAETETERPFEIVRERDYSRDRARRPSEGSLARSIGESSIASSPASSVMVPIRPVEPGAPPKGSYSQRLLALARAREGAGTPGTPAPRRRGRGVGERTPLVGARSGRRYVPRRSSIDEVNEDEEEAIAGLRRTQWFDLKVGLSSPIVISMCSFS